MYILCPLCEDPKNNLWVTVGCETATYNGRFAGRETVYWVEDVLKTCKCEYNATVWEKVEEAAIEAFVEGE